MRRDSGGAGHLLPAPDAVPTATGEGGPICEFVKFEEEEDNNPVEAGVGGGAAGPLAGVENALKLGLAALLFSPPLAKAEPDMEAEEAGVRGGVKGV